MSQAEQLRMSRLGRVLTDAQVERLSQISVSVNAPAGTRLFEEGCPAEALWVICSGTVAIEMHVPGHPDVRLLTLGARDLLGWSALVGDGHMTASAVVSRDAVLLRMATADLRKQCENDDRLGLAVMENVARILAERLKATRLQLLDLHDGSGSDAAHAGDWGSC